MPRKKPKKRMTDKARVELEKRLLGRLLADAEYGGDIREKVCSLGISWRNFRDKRHRAIWRALEVLDLKSVEARMDIIASEMDAEASEEVNADPRLIDPEVDMVMGQPGSAARKDFKKRLIEDSSNAVAWLGRELEAAGAFPVVGGKKYLQIIAEIGRGELLFPEHLAEDLFVCERRLLNVRRN